MIRIQDLTKISEYEWEIPKGFRPDMRVRHGGRVFDIIAVMDVEERHREIKLMCVEGGKQA